jgi:hypothetical protein
MGWRWEPEPGYRDGRCRLTAPRYDNVYEGDGTWVLRRGTNWLDWARIPDYPNDLDACMRDMPSVLSSWLFDGINLMHVFDGTGLLRGWMARIWRNRFNDTIFPEAHGSANTAARAVCEAFAEAHEIRKTWQGEEEVAS